MDNQYTNSPKFVPVVALTASVVVAVCSLFAVTALIKNARNTSEETK